VAESRCGREEEVLRAITDPAHFDHSKNRVSSTVFRGSNISVSRLKILSFDSLVKIFKQELEQNGKNKLIKTGQLSVADIEDITGLFVEEKPTEENPAHAEIIGEIKSRSISNKLKDKMKVEDII